MNVKGLKAGRSARDIALDLFEDNKALAPAREAIAQRAEHHGRRLPGRTLAIGRLDPIRRREGSCAVDSNLEIYRMSAESCGNCRFWLEPPPLDPLDRRPPDRDLGSCRRYPPSPIFGGDRTPATVFRQTPRTLWCGDWKADASRERGIYDTLADADPPALIFPPLWQQLDELEAAVSLLINRASREPSRLLVASRKDVAARWSRLRDALVGLT